MDICSWGRREKKKSKRRMRRRGTGKGREGEGREEGKRKKKEEEIERGESIKRVVMETKSWEDFKLKKLTIKC